MNDAIPRSEVERIDWDHLACLIKSTGTQELDENVESYLTIRHKQTDRRRRVTQYFEITLVETPIEEAVET